MKNNKLLIILLVVFIIISIVLAGYVIYDKYYFSTDNLNVSDEDETDEQNDYELLNTSSSIVNSLLSGFDQYEDIYIGDYFGYFYTQDRDITTMSDEDKLVYVVIKYATDYSTLFYSDLNSLLCDDGINSCIPVEKLDSYALYALGNNDYEYVDFDAQCYGVWTYDNESLEYILNGGGCGGTGYANEYYRKITQVRRYDDRIEIDMQVILIEYEDKDSDLESSDWVANVYTADASKKLLATVDDEANFGYIEDNYIEQGSTYTFTFVEEDDNYYFSNSKLIEN